MALPSTLSNFTSPILDKALKTGARGVTQTTTNYGVIGDAFFKKAQLELGVANLQADIGIKKAQIMGGLEMDKARLELQKGEIMANAYMRKAELESQMVSDTEKILGTIGGAASGAVAGFAVGGPVGAAVGGTLGGAVAYGGYSQSRQAGQQAVQTVGLVSNAAVAIKGWNDTKKKEDGFKTVMDNVNRFKGLMDSATNVQDFNAARDSYQQAVSGMASGMAKAGWNPQEIADFQAKFTSGSKGIYSQDASEFDEAYMGKLSNLMRNDKILNNDSIDQSYKDAKIAGYLGEASSTMNRINKYDPTKVMTADAAQSFGDATGHGQAVYDFLNPTTPVAGVSIAATQPKIQAAAPSAAPASSPRVSTPAATQTQAPIPQAPQVQMSGAPMENHIPFAPAPVQVPMAPDVTSAPGVTMFTQPVNAERELAKMGAETVDTLKLNDQRSDAKRLAMKEEYTNNPYSNDGARPTASAKPAEKVPVDAGQSQVRAAMANKKIDEYSAQIEKNLEEASKHKYMSTDGLARGEYVRTAKSGLDDVKALIPRLPHDDQLKSAAAKVYLQGLKLDNVGQAMGATIGMKGGIAGVLAGNVVGDTAGSVLSDFDAGKGSATVGQLLTEDERDALDQYYSAVMNTIPSFVKSGDATQVTNDEFIRTASPFINYGQTEGQKFRTLEVQYKKLVNTSAAVAEFSEAGMQQYEYKESSPIMMRQRSDIDKAGPIALERQTVIEGLKNKPKSYIETIRNPRR